MQTHEFVEVLRHEIVDRQCKDIFKTLQSKNFTREQLVAIASEFAYQYEVTLENLRYEGKHDIIANSCVQVFDDIMVDMINGSGKND